MYKVAIDGASGTGKSTLAKRAAKRLGCVYVDTGALYRSIGLYVYENGLDPEDADAVSFVLPNIGLELKYEDGVQHVILNGRDVSDTIRLPEISMYASKVSKIPQVRAFLLGTQRDMAKKNNVIMDGRDIGTVIFPDAEVKIFVTVREEIKAQRRYKELIEKGVETTYEDVLRDMRERDAADASRDIAPCVPAKDAVMFDNSDAPLEKAVDMICKIITDKVGK